MLGTNAAAHMSFMLTCCLGIFLLICYLQLYSYWLFFCLYVPASDDWLMPCSMLRWSLDQRVNPTEP